MSGRIALALAIHNHQPVGNFGWVFEDVFEKAYLPLVDALERHPAVRLSLHYTGPLLEWVEEHHPEFLERLRALVERDQVEILGGGQYEPVLVSLPRRDRLGQLRLMSSEVERLFGRPPRGAWLAERVWEPQLPSVLVDAGYDWTILDDNHFRSASIAEDEMWGAYVTEDDGRLLRVFGTEQGLRYRIPFGQPEDVIAYLRDHATEDGRRVGMMGDDGEKFGAWPGTYEHCWGRTRWVDRFFELLEQHADWLTTVKPSDWLDREPPVGRVYVPTASYVEMGEWALPADESNTFTALIKRAFADDLPEKRFLRGGFWRNFQARYREINDLHKQMLRVSAKVAAMPPGDDRDEALDHLYRGQSNDCYWHGLFGGIYIVHMRLATFAHLIAAEDIADAALLRAKAAGRAEAAPVSRSALAGVAGIAGGGAPGLVGGMAHQSDAEGAATVTAGIARVPATVARVPDGPRTDPPDPPHDPSAGAGALAGLIGGMGGAATGTWTGAPTGEHLAPPDGAALLDTDLDGVLEAYLAAPGQVVVVDVAEGAAIGSWDLRATRLALASVLRRRHEAYHDTLVAHESIAEDGHVDGGAPKTIHDIVMTKEPGLSRRLIYDRHERRSGMLHVVPAGTDAEAFRLEGHPELCDALEAPYALVRLAGGEMTVERATHVAEEPVTVRKILRLAGGRLDPSLSLDVEIEHHGSAAIHADLVLEWNVDLAGGGGNPAAYYEIGGRRFAHDSTEAPGATAALAFGNDHEGAAIGATMVPAADVAWYPVETISNSEAGFERQYQGSCLLLRWPLVLEPGDSMTAGVRFDVASARDHLAEERAGR